MLMLGMCLLMFGPTCDLTAIPQNKQFHHAEFQCGTGGVLESASMALQDTAADGEPLSQQRTIITPLADPQGNLWGLDTEARRKRARHSSSGGAVPRTLGFEAAASDNAALAHPAALHADGAAEAERGRHNEESSRVDFSKEDEAEAEAYSSGSSDSEDTKASAGGAAAAAAKALARVMRLQSERSRLQHAIQVAPSLCAH